MNNKTSIIVCAYDKNIISRQITSACLGNIEKYTDKEDYELILIDNEPCGDLNTRQNMINLDKHIVNEKDIGFSASMNLGTKESNSDNPYVCFVHNDTFVWEGWLPKLRSYLEGGDWDVIWPTQGQMTRDQVKQSYNEEGRGWDDAGLIMMHKDTFNKIGGWDERFRSVYQDLAFRNKMGGLRTWCTNQVIITHLGAITIFADMEKFARDRHEETKFLNE